MQLLGLFQLRDLLILGLSKVPIRLFRRRMQFLGLLRRRRMQLLGLCRLRDLLILGLSKVPIRLFRRHLQLLGLLRLRDLHKLGLSPVSMIELRARCLGLWPGRGA